MKRILTSLFTILLALTGTTAQVASYHPFVERGKYWCVHGFCMGTEHTVTNYYFSLEEINFERNGHVYEQLRARSDDGDDRFVGWLREENQRVYLYDESAGKEFLTYDFSLQEGDSFEPECGDYRNCEVTKVDTITLNGQQLRTITFDANDIASDAAVRSEVTWIEGIGSRTGPLDGLYSDHLANSWSRQVAYASGSTYLPLSFSDPYNGWWGQNLVKGREADTDNQQDDLRYELVQDPNQDSYVLHVNGIMHLSQGDNYICCSRKNADEAGKYKLYLSSWPVFNQFDSNELADPAMATYHVDLYFPSFQPEQRYVVVDNSGEHSVAVRSVSDRCFIEDGKVWKVGTTIGQGMTATKLDYYYFDTDTISIDGRICRNMLCRHEVASGSDPWTECVGAVCEEDRHVYWAAPGSDKLELIYNFDSPEGATFAIYARDNANTLKYVTATVTKRALENSELFKGLSVTLSVEASYTDNGVEHHARGNGYWMQGIGSTACPLDNIVLAPGNSSHLMSCTVNDEVLYHNPDLIDGVTPQDLDVKKQWLDFTHVVKPRPKAPLKTSSAVHVSERQGDGLTGEYSIKDLFVNLNSLSGPYTITIADAAGQEVYRKEVQTSNVVAINTDISAYNKGIYTLTIENDDESYSATFCINGETAIRDITQAQMGNGNSVNDRCYDLTGRRISPNKLLHSAGKGIYIRDGKKVVR